MINPLQYKHKISIGFFVFFVILAILLAAVWIVYFAKKLMPNQQHQQPTETPTRGQRPD